MSPPVVFRSDTSPKWTPALLRDLGVTLDKDDGCFYISWADFKKYPGHARTHESHALPTLAPRKGSGTVPTYTPPRMLLLPPTLPLAWCCSHLQSPHLALVLPSGLLVVFEKPNRSSFTCTLLHPPLLPSPGMLRRYFVGVTVCYLVPPPPPGSGPVPGARWREVRRKALLTKAAPAACFSLTCKTDTVGWVTVSGPQAPWSRDVFLGRGARVGVSVRPPHRGTGYRGTGYYDIGEGEGVLVVFSLLDAAHPLHPGQATLTPLPPAHTSVVLIRCTSGTSGARMGWQSTLTCACASYGWARTAPRH
jgi:hypothetical protein